MRNKLFVLIVVMGLLFCFTACGQKSEPVSDTEETIQGETAQEEMTYISSDGFQLSYDPGIVSCTEVDQHTVRFDCIAESDGENTMTVSFVSGKQPEEVLSEKTADWGNEEKTERREGFFPGTTDKWGYYRELNLLENGAGQYMTAIAGEYNGEVLLFEIAENKSGEGETDIAVSDAFSGILNSITYDDFEKQSMYDYYPGTYTSSDADGTYTITLNEDHTGTFDFQDIVPVIWGTYLITTEDGSFEYEFSIEGDNIMLDYDGTWLSFERT